MGLPFFSRKNPKEDNFLPKLDLNDIRRVAKSSGRTKKDVLEEELITELNKDLKEIRESTLENPQDESYDVVGVIENPDKTPIKNLSELIEFVKSIPESDLKKYVNPKFNLFSDFAQDKFGQIALSVELALLNNKQDIISKLQAFLISEGDLTASNREKSNEKNDASEETGQQGNSASNQRKTIRREAQKILMKTPDTKAFVFGKTKLTSLEELFNAINSLPLREVIREIDNKRIELANWLETSIGDSELANRVLSNYEPKNIITLIEDRLRFLKDIAQETDGEEQQAKDVESGKDSLEESEDTSQIDEVEPLEISSVKINSVPELISFISELDEDGFDSKIKPLKKDITDWVVKVSGEEDLSTLVFSSSKSDFLEKIESARYSGIKRNKKKGKRVKRARQATLVKKDEPDKKVLIEKQTESTCLDSGNKTIGKENLNNHTDTNANRKEANIASTDDRDKDDGTKGNNYKNLESSDSENLEVEGKLKEEAYKSKEPKLNKEEIEKGVEVKQGDGEVGFFDDETEKKVEELASEIEIERPIKEKQKGISKAFEEDLVLKITKEKGAKELPAPTKPDEIRQPKNEYLASLVKTDVDKMDLEYAQKSSIIKNRSELIDKKVQEASKALEDAPTQFMDNEKADYVSQTEDEKKIEDKVDLLYSERVPNPKASRETLFLPKNPDDDFIESIENRDIEFEKAELSEGRNPFEAEEINKYFKEYANAAKDAISLNVREMESAIELKKEEIKLLNETIDSKKFMIETEIKEQVRGFNELKERLRAEINSLIKERNELESQIELLKENLSRKAPISGEEITELKANIEKLNERIKKQEAIILGYKENPSSANPFSLKPMEGSVVESGGVIDLVKSSNNIDVANDDIGSIRERIVKLEEENKRLLELNKAIEKGLSPKEKAVINFAELKSELATAKKEVGKRKSELNKIERDIESKRSELNTLLSDIEYIKNLKAVRSQLKADSERLEELRKEVEIKEIELNNITKLLDSARDDYSAIVASGEAKVTEPKVTPQKGESELINPSINPNEDGTTVGRPTLDDTPLEQSALGEPGPFENLSADGESNVNKSFDELLDGLNGGKQGEEASENVNELEKRTKDVVETAEATDGQNLFEEKENNFEFDLPEPIIAPVAISDSKKAGAKKKKEIDNQEAPIDNFVPEFDKELSGDAIRGKADLKKASKKPAGSSKTSKAKQMELEPSEREKEEIEAKSKKLLEELERDSLKDQKEAQSIENQGSEIINKESFGKKPKPVDTYVKTIDTLEDVYDAIREARNLVDIRKFDEANDRIQEIEEAASKMKLGSSDKKRIEVEMRLLKLEVEIA